ncbi:MAG: hypothetical protein B7Z80_04885 [Rhodospirillales bacterium 20-64-7]|nr:MAG: hypothetical protein B7Z80_04885 [Rhodospirillales bacterium 20-64-7]
MNGKAVTRQNVLVGLFRIARGRADGVGCFGATPQAFLASLAPLIAFPLVAAGLGMFTEGPRRALTGLAIAICAMLTPAVISFELARIWKRADAWLRFATAFNWCEWILPAIAFLTMVPLSAAIGAGMSETVASAALITCLVVYGLWLHWFLARKALGLSGYRAVLLVVLVNLGTAVVVLGPHWLAGAFA